MNTRWWALVMVLALVAASCGGDSDDGDSTSAGDSAPADDAGDDGGSSDDGGSDGSDAEEREGQAGHQDDGERAPPEGE